MATYDYNMRLNTGRNAFPVFNPTQFTPKEKNVNLLVNSLDKIESRNLAAAQQEGKLDEALAKIEVNLHQDPETKQWFNGLKQQYKDRISNLVASGDYGEAIRYGIRAAGEIANNSELQARMQSNAEYQNQKKVVDTMVANGKLPDRIAKQWMEENPYEFKPITDKNGRVIGGEEWRPNWTPIEPIDMTQVYTKIGQLAAEEAGGGQNVRFVDENGKPVANPTSGMYAMEIKSGSTWHRMPASKLKAMFKAALDQIPGARETFEQDYNNRLWQYNKTNGEDKRDFYGSDIIDNQGNIKTLDEYINYKANPILESMAYNRIISTVDYSPNTAYLKARAESSASGAGIEDFISSLRTGNQSIGSDINIPMKDELSQYYNSVNGALKTINDIFNSSNVKGRINNSVFNVMFQNYVQQGDYNSLAKYIDNLTQTGFNPQERAVLDAAIRRLKADGNAYNDIIVGMDEDDIKTLNTYASLTTGAPFLNAKDNKYAQEVAAKRNRLFQYADSKTGRARYADKFGLSFIDENILNGFIKELGIDRNFLESHGIYINKTNGKIVLDIDKNTDMLPIIGKALETMDNTSRRSWSFNNNFGRDKISIVKYDDKGNVVISKASYADQYEGTRQNLKDFSPTSQYSTNLEEKVNNILTSYGKTMTITPQVLGDKSFTGRMIKDNAELFGLKRTDIMAYDKAIAEDDRNLVIQGLSHIKDFRTFNENGDVVQPNEVEDLQEYLNSAIADNKFVPLPALIPTAKGYAWQITIPEFKNKDGKVQGGKTILVEGLIEDIAAKYLSQSPEAMYNREYQQARAINKSVYDIFGNRIIYDRGDENIEKGKFIASLQLNDAYDSVARAAMNNQEITNEEFIAVSSGIVSRSGIDIQTDYGRSQVAKIATDLRNKYIQILTSN